MLTVLAHGVGSRGGLPLPLWQFAWAATAALVVSFVALGVLWDRPRLSGAAAGRPVGWSPRALTVAQPIARAASLTLFLLVLAAGLFGTDDAARNIAPVAVYVVFWVVLQSVIPVIGDVWAVLSPFDTIGRALDRIRSEPTPAPAWSHWVAPAGAFGFLFIELAHPSGDSPRVLGWAMLVYLAVVVAAVWRWGRSWLPLGETFTVLFGLLGAMAPVRRDDEGQLRFRPPLSGLAAIDVTPAATALILIVLGGTTFDGFSASDLWVDLAGRPEGWSGAAWSLFGLVDAIIVLSALYLIGVQSMAAATGRQPRELASVFAPSLVPISFGYTLAHYLQLAVDESQTFVFHLSDPFGRGWDLFGGADARVNFDLVSVDAIAWCQALGIVVGHIAGVLVAHDRAVAVFDQRDATRSQYVMLFVMVLYSVLGLWLLRGA